MHTYTNQRHSFKTILITLAWIFLLSAGFINAQTPERRKAGPEDKKLEVWVGDWQYEGVGKPTPFGPGGKFAGKQTARMIMSGLFLETKWEDKGLSGTEVDQGTTIQSYDPKTKTYADRNFGNDGNMTTGTTTVDGNTWTGTSILTDDKGKNYKAIFHNTLSSDGNTCTSKSEISPDDGKTWMPNWELTMKKVKSVQSTTTQRQSAKDAIAAANKEFELAFSQGDAVILGNQYSKKAQMFSRGEEITQGREAIIKEWNGMVSEYKGASVKVQSTEIQENGNWAYEVGLCEFIGNNENILSSVNYLLIWVYEDEQWKIHRDIANDTPFVKKQSAKKGIEQWHQKCIDLNQKGDGASFAKMFTTDAAIGSVGQPFTRGQEAIQRVVQEDATRIQAEKIKQELTNLEVEQDGDTAYNVCKVVEKGPDGNILDEGIAVGFWKRIGGVWKLHRDYWNSTQVKK